MSEKFDFELVETERPNRFQVNPVENVNRTSNNGARTEVFEEDTFNDDEIVLRNNRRSSR